MPMTESNFIKAFAPLVGSSDDDYSLGSDTLAARKALLEKHLKRTGRAPTDVDDDGQGDRAEKYAGKVLKSIERSTQDLQRRRNREIDDLIENTDKDIESKKLAIAQKQQEADNLKSQITKAEKKRRRSPKQQAALDLLYKQESDKLVEKAEMELALKRLEDHKKALTRSKSRTTHAVSAHGKGTDQIGRVLHGRRSDEVDDSPPDMVTLEGNDKFVKDSKLTSKPETPEYTTVGKDPSNTSGAFNTHQGMLGVINEAFAQADKVTRTTDEDDDDRARKKDKSSLADKRLVTSVKGEDNLGYNIEAQGLSSQKSGDTIQADEIAERYKSLKRTEGLKNARVVLDPSYIDDKQVGWNLQTAFATGDDPDDEENEALRELTHRSELAKKAVDTKKEDLDLTKQQIAIKEERLSSAKRIVADKDKDIKEIEDEIAEYGKQVGSMESELDTLTPEDGELDLIARLKEMLKDLSSITKSAVSDLSSDFSDFYGTTSEAFSKAEQIISKLEDMAKQMGRKGGMERTRQQKQQDVDTIEGTLEKDQIYQDLLAKKLVQEKALKDAEADALLARKAVVEATPETPDTVPTPQAGYNPQTGQYEAADRPSKPGVLKGTDEEYDSLTAHHLYPWNKIRSDLNRALSKQDAGALRQLFAFGEFKPGPDFFKDLKKPSDQRGYRFTSDVNTAAQMICWSPKNIFMGPSSSKRGDDPGEELDQAPTDGEDTFSTKLAALLEEQGGLGAVLDDDEIQAYLEEQEQDKKAKDDSYVVKDIDESAIKAELVARVRKSMIERTIERLEAKKQPVNKAQIEKDLTTQMVEDELAKRKLAAVKVKEMMETRSEMEDKPQEYDSDEWELDGEGKKVRKRT